MALTNAQYDEIRRNYDAIQLHNQSTQQKRLEKAFAENPRLQEIEGSIASISVAQARKLLDGDRTALDSLKKQLADLREERQAILASLPYPEGYFDPIYNCKDCKDTGYVDDLGTKCHCFKQAIINTVYAQSNIRSILEKENFSTLAYEYYSGTNKNPITGLSDLDTFKDAVNKSRAFIENFEHKPQNLFFFGNTGVGKTFLSNCVAKELLDRGYSVIYFTAFELFDILSKGIFEHDADAIAAHQNIFDCDLLIIDDLGTELSNKFTTSQLFLIINERILRQKSTIISTNLDMGRIVDTYSERTFSRISSNYTIMKLSGDDIRIQKRSR